LNEEEEVVEVALVLRWMALGAAEWASGVVEQA